MKKKTNKKTNEIDVTVTVAESDASLALLRLRVLRSPLSLSRENIERIKIQTLNELQYPLGPFRTAIAISIFYVLKKPLPLILFSIISVNPANPRMHCGPEHPRIQT